MDTTGQATTRQLKYVQIAEALKADIQARRLVQNDRLPSFLELRQRYGAAPATASQVYKLLEREGLVARKRGHGVYVGAPRRVGTGIIALAGAQFRNRHRWPYWDSLYRGIEMATEGAGYEILLAKSGSNSIQLGKVDGVIATNGEASLDQMPAALPRISLLLSSEGISSVTIDEYHGMRTAINHLTALGHRKIAYLGIDLSGYASHRRFSAYREGLIEAGIEVDPQRVYLMPTPLSPDGTSFGGKEVMTNWLRGDWDDLGCTAIVAHNDDIAIGILQAFEEAGVDVPGEVSVVGFDGLETGDECSPRLTTVEVPLQQIGIVGIEMLIRQIESGMNSPPAAASCTLLPTTLRVRESTAPPCSS